MKYKDWLEEWLKNYIEPTVKARTFIRYSDIAKYHLIPKLGECEMEEITPFVLQHLITELLQSGNLRTGKGLIRELGRRDYQCGARLVAYCFPTGVFEGVSGGQNQAFESARKSREQLFGSRAEKDRTSGFEQQEGEDVWHFTLPLHRTSDR